MKVIYEPIDTGKTRKLIEESSLTGAVIITVDDFRAKRLKAKAEAYGIEIPNPVSWDDVCDGQGKMGHYLIDDLDRVLESVLGAKVDTVVITKED